MAHIRDVLDRTTAVCAAVVLLAAAVVSAVPLKKADALVLSNRSLEVTSTNPSDDLAAPDGHTYTVDTGSGGELSPGDPRNGTRVGHKYTFTPTQGTTIKAIKFKYCSAAFEYLSTCNTPTGFTAANAPSALVTPSGGGTARTFTVKAGATANEIIMVNATGVAVVLSQLLVRRQLL
jgi:hypothetical protein